jgi:hypothetical protein
MKKAMLVTAIGAIALGANAGDWGKAPVGKSPVIEECVDLGGQISAGYMTDYIFYGVRFAGDSVWTDVNYTIEGLPLPITLGAWYLNGIAEDSLGNGGYDELNLYLSAALGTYGGFDVALGYTHYTFPEFRSNVAPVGGYGELGLDITRSLGFVDLAFESNYAMGGGGTSPSGWYHQLGFEKSFGLTDSIGLVVGTGVGYSDGYFAVGGLVPNAFSPRSSGWNHYYVRASLPIELNCRTTLTPYIGYNGSPDTFITDGIAGSNKAQTDILHGGVTLSVGF